LQILSGATPRHISMGQVIPWGSATDPTVHIVCTGAVLLSSVGPGVRGCAMEVLGPGEVFGQVAWGGGGRMGPGDIPTPAQEGLALVSTRLLTLSATDLAEWLRTDLALAGGLSQAIGFRLGRLQKALWRSLSMKALDRTSDLLSELAIRFGRSVPGGALIGLPLTQEMLASLVGVSRETVNRAVRTLTDQGRLLHDGRRYIVRGETGQCALSRCW